MRHFFWLMVLNRIQKNIQILLLKLETECVSNYLNQRVSDNNVLQNLRELECAVKEQITFLEEETATWYLKHISDRLLIKFTGQINASLKLFQQLERAISQ
jgi:hypothetical protein